MLDTSMRASLVLLQVLSRPRQPVCFACARAHVSPERRGCESGRSALCRGDTVRKPLPGGVPAYAAALQPRLGVHTAVPSVQGRLAGEEQGWLGGTCRSGVVLLANAGTFIFYLHMGRRCVVEPPGCGALQQQLCCPTFPPCFSLFFRV